MRILIVDDEYVSLLKLNLLLERYGECDSATNGEQAMELINLALEENEPYDLITMDISMNGQSGIETLRNIRNIQGYGDTVVVIMITGMTDEISLSQCFLEGCTKILTKPVARLEIENAMDSLGFTMKQ